MIRQQRCWCMIMIKVILLVQSWHVQEMWWLKSPDDNAMKKNIKTYYDDSGCQFVGSWPLSAHGQLEMREANPFNFSKSIHLPWKWRHMETTEAVAQVMTSAVMMIERGKQWHVKEMGWAGGSLLLYLWGPDAARHYSASLNSFTHARVGYDWHCDIPPSMHNVHCLCNAHWMEHWDQSPVRRDSASLGFWMWLNFWGVILPAVPPNLYFGQWLCQQPYHSAKQQGHLDGSHQNY